MEQFLHSLIVALIYVIWIILIPPFMLLATPFILFWPTKKMIDGTKEKRDIKGRYKKAWDLWKSIGLGLPIP